MIFSSGKEPVSDPSITQHFLFVKTRLNAADTVVDLCKLSWLGFNIEMNHRRLPGVAHREPTPDNGKNSAKMSRNGQKLVEIGYTSTSEVDGVGEGAFLTLGDRWGGGGSRGAPLGPMIRPWESPRMYVPKHPQFMYR